MSKPSLSRVRPAMGSWPGGLLVRRVVMDDIRTLNGGEGIDPAYCIGEPVGYAAERDGELLATGSVTWDRYGRAWGWFNRRGRVAPSTMHRCALEMLGMLRRVGEPEIYMICNLAIPGAEKWVKRLGFVRDERLPHPWGPVYRCDLISAQEIATPISEVATGI